MAGPRFLRTLRPRPLWWRHVLGYASLFLGSTISRITVKGKWHLPKSGPFIVASNHFSYYDPPFFTYAIQKPINFIAASDQEIDWWFMWAPIIYGWIPVDREKINPSTIKLAVEVLKKGQILGIFPDGGGLEDVLGKAKNGAVYLSTLADAPIVPMAIYGAETAWEDLFKGLRPRVWINIGKPFGPYKIKGNKSEKNEMLKKIGHQLMCRISSLLPENRRGKYFNEPSVKTYERENKIFPVEHKFYTPARLKNN
mgnify:FL=1|tara:strand:- start:1818 stop:2579 length:762 start_codon:yes stop_codon:yes gene_type:complete